MLPSDCVSTSTALPGNNPASALTCFGRVSEPFFHIRFEVFIAFYLLKNYLKLCVLTLHFHGLVTVPDGAALRTGNYPRELFCLASIKAFIKPSNKAFAVFAFVFS